MNPKFIISIIFALTLICISSDVYASGDIPISEIKYKTAHNSFVFNSTFEEHIRRDQFQAIELDIGKKKLLFKKKNDWWVYHHPLHLKSNVKKLSKALAIVKETVTEQNSYGDKPFFIFLDIRRLSRKKAKRYFDEIENLARTKLGKILYTYQDMLNNCPGTKYLKQVLKKCGWPTEEELQRKVLIIITKGRKDYYFSILKKKVFFRADNNLLTNKHTAVLNFPLSKIESIVKKKKADIYLQRVYKVKTPEDLEKARGFNVNFIAIDENLKNY